MPMTDTLSMHDWITPLSTYYIKKKIHFNHSISEIVAGGAGFWNAIQCHKFNTSWHR